MKLENEGLGRLSLHPWLSAPRPAGTPSGQGEGMEGSEGGLEGKVIWVTWQDRDEGGRVSRGRFGGCKRRQFGEQGSWRDGALIGQA